VVSVPAAERRGLAEALELAAGDRGGLDVAAADVDRHPAPFLRRFAIYRVVHWLPNHPVGFYSAWAPGEPAYLLTGEPQNFVAAALADGVSLDDPDAARAYAVAYLETTRRPDELLYVVGSTDEVRFYPELDEAEQERVAAFNADYGAIVEPPAVRPEDDGWRVTLFAMRQQTLERVSLRVERFGAIELSGEALEGDLPAVFAA
jgi:hypothetical protein